MNNEGRFAKILQLLERIERECEVNAIRCDGEKVWPLIRMFLWRQLVHGPNTLNTKPHPRTLIPSAFTIRDPIPCPGMSLPESCEALFLSRHENHVEKIGGKWINSYLDPYLELVKRKFTTLKLEIEDPGKEARALRFYDGVHFQQPSVAAFTETPFSLENWDEFQEKAEPLLGFPIPESNYLLGIHELRLYKAYFSRLLQKIKPKIVFIICWYYERWMSLCWACRDLGIPTVDLQHGKQGKYHGLYSHWGNLPEDGYALMPKYFWTWGKESQENFGQWIPANHAFHQAVVGGNQWLAGWKKGRYFAEGEIFQNLARKCALYSRVILVSLQPIEPVLAKCIEELLLNSASEWLWLIRLHPAQRKDLFAFSEKFKKFPAKVEIESSTALPLFAVLQLTTHHITGFSSVAYEASQFDIPTAINHPEGFALYGKEFASGSFTKVSTGLELEAWIGGPGKGCKKLDNSYISTEDSDASQALDWIMKDSIELS